MDKVWTEEMIRAEKERMDRMSQEELARLQRFAQAGHPYFRADLPLFEYFSEKFEGWTPELSKRIGWDR